MLPGVYNESQGYGKMEKYKSDNWGLTDFILY